MKDVINFLKVRRSVTAKNMVTGFVNDEDLNSILSCGIRVPDHGALTPWLLTVIRDEARNRNVKEIISTEWISKMKIPSVNNDTFGYMWWLNWGDRMWDDLSDNIFYGSGFGGNYVIVVPDHELVIVARWIDSSKIGDFVKKVIEAHK